MTWKKYLIYLISLFLFGSIQVQAQQDSLLLTYEQFLQKVYQEHPIAIQINLMRDKANRYLQKSRGGFDPKLGANWDFKDFKDKNYYNILQTHLKVPVWSGVTIEGGYNYAAGYYLNPENTLPSAGQAYLGLNLSLLKGLWTDDRRAAIQQAKVLQQASEAEIAAALNDLLYKAAKSYWEWTKAYNNLLVVRQSLQLAQNQLAIMRGSYLQGDKPAIDTLKIYIQVQERTILLQQTELNFYNTGRTVASFLWEKGQTPLDLQEGMYPTTLEQLVAQPLGEDLLNANLSQLDQHPALQLYQFKFENLEIERRLKVNKLLPKLDFKYNFLSSNHVAFFESPAAPIENYKLGIKFSMPLFLRKERAELELTKLKIREVGYQQTAKQRDLRIKIENYYNEAQNYANQTNELAKMVANYELLLDAERIKLEIGESSVFMINTRENQLLEAQLKLIKQKIAYLKSRTAFFWITANLATNID